VEHATEAQERHVIARAIGGLYAITPDVSDTRHLASMVEQALTGGVKILQYRNKIASAELRKEQALTLRNLTRQFDCIFIVNDEIDLALSVAADGVHWGRDDAAFEALAAARRDRLSEGFVIGVSCYNDLSRVRDAAKAGADYVALGSFFPSTVKPAAAKADLSLIGAAKAITALPIVAIGGIAESNASRVVQAGADALAVISSLFNADDIHASAKRLTTLIDNAHVHHQN
jgi:thiamine-phosphate pyrophosphorylase